MRDDERSVALEDLDREMKHFRLAARAMTRGWRDKSQLRRLRHVLGIPMAEIVDALNVNRSVLGRMEQSEARRTISLKSLDRAAAAMGCKVVYGIVPANGETVTEMGERRRFLKAAIRFQGSGNREQGTGNRKRSSSDCPGGELMTTEN
jgi:transcriptional regulator with XRE-family HTH domain